MCIKNLKHTTEEDAVEAPFVLEVVSYQHPDRDTDRWPQDET